MGSVGAVPKAPAAAAAAAPPQGANAPAPGGGGAAAGVDPESLLDNREKQLLRLLRQDNPDDPTRA
eukprot:5555692-Alexandrium_andersonii.AAC.1